MLVGIGCFFLQRRKQQKRSELEERNSNLELAGLSSQEIWELPHKPDTTPELQSPHGTGEIHGEEREIRSYIPSYPQELEGDEPLTPGTPRSPVGLDYISPVDIENMHSSWSARSDQRSDQRSDLRSETRTLDELTL